MNLSKYFFPTFFSILEVHINKDLVDVPFYASGRYLVFLYFWKRNQFACVITISVGTYPLRDFPELFLMEVNYRVEGLTRTGFSS